MTAFERDLRKQDQADVQPVGIEPGMIALDDAAPLQLAHARKAGAGGQRDPLGERLVGEPPFGLKDLQNLAVDAVQWIVRAHDAHTAESAEAVNTFNPKCGATQGTRMQGRPLPAAAL